MNSTDLKSRLMDKVMSKAESIIDSKARMFTALLKYEIAVANTELAMRGKEHGYDFKFIPEDYANAAVIGQAQREDGQITMSITIPQHALKDASDSMIAYFKTYIVANAMTKLRNGI